MPAPLNVNREAVKTLAVAIGVRQAARELGLPEKTVLAWSHRHNWFPDNQPPAPPVIRGQRAVQSSAVKSPAAALSDRLAVLGDKSKLALAKAGDKASGYLSKRTGKEITAKSGDFKNVIGGLAQLYGWDTRFQGTQFSLNVLNLGSFGIEVDNS